jgi:hypothetical protein
MSATRTVPVAAEDRQRLKALVLKVGQKRAVELVGIPQSTLERVLAELPVRAGTRIALKQGLQGIDGGAS